MNGAIYLIQNDGSLVAMKEQEYKAEALLQELLSRYPNLLAGEQMDSTEPRRWLLVAREVGVPGEEESGDRWSLDHLFLDQDGIPTLVEVKRSKSTEIRRKIVGQMLDYAANATVYWPPEKIRSLFEENCNDEGDDPEEKLMELLQDDEADIEEFWEQVEDNLRVGKIRMVFVADEIPPELQSIVEFLARQMNPAQVFAVEVKQYVGKNSKVLVPRVFGRISSTKPPVDLEEFLEMVPSEVRELAEAILEWTIKERRLKYNLSKKGKNVMLILPNSRARPISISTAGHLCIRFGYMKNKYGPPFDNESKCRELLQRLNSIEGINLPSDRIDKFFPKIRLELLKEQVALNKFLEIFDWIIQEYEKAPR